jgi:UDP-N-acetyl-D-glucosamine dehydrogenase
MRGTAVLRRRILARRANVAVVGQGYVGVSLASAASEAGFDVVGVDVDAARIGDLANGELSVPGVSSALFQAGIDAGNVAFTTDLDALREAEVILICVPTPVRDHTPDLSFVERATQDVAERLSAGRLVLLESTTYPGTTEELVKPILESSGMVAGRDFLLAYSPERIDPGNEEYGLRNTPKLVGGITPEATGLASLFYEQFVEKVTVVSSCRAAELAKLLENTFRHVNIALVNEMATLCHEVGIDVWEVTEAAATKPFGFMAFAPGPGVGGHCIPLDPAYLAWQVRRDAGRQFRILEEAQDINARMPGYVAGRIGDALNDSGKPVKGARILVLGVAYKSDVGDVRESPAIEVMTILGKRGADVVFSDPHVTDLVLGGLRAPSTALTQREISRADCVALLTPHHAYDLDWIAEHATLIFDGRNAFGADRRPNVVRL